MRRLQYLRTLASTSPPSSKFARNFLRICSSVSSPLTYSGWCLTEYTLLWKKMICSTRTWDCLTGSLCTSNHRLLWRHHRFCPVSWSTRRLCTFDLRSFPAKMQYIIVIVCLKNAYTALTLSANKNSVMLIDPLWSVSNLIALDIIDNQYTFGDEPNHLPTQHVRIEHFLHLVGVTLHASVGQSGAEFFQRQLFVTVIVHATEHPVRVQQSDTKMHSQTSPPTYRPIPKMPDAPRDKQSSRSFSTGLRMVPSSNMRRLLFINSDSPRDIELVGRCDICGGLHTIDDYQNNNIHWSKLQCACCECDL